MTDSRISGHRVAGVPVLMARPPASITTPLPTVLWFHGFRADALAHAAELERCARAGVLAVGVDAVGHGARADSSIADRIARDGSALPLMLEQVEQTVDELPALLRALVDDYHADQASVSVVGISMGAFLVYRAIAAGVPVRAAVALLGSPEWPSPTSAHLTPDRFRNVAMLSVTAEHDMSVPPPAVARFHAALIKGEGATRFHRHDVLAGAGHLLSATQWAHAMSLTHDWLAQYGT